MALGTPPPRCLHSVASGFVVRMSSHCCASAMSPRLPLPRAASVASATFAYAGSASSQVFQLCLSLCSIAFSWRSSSCFRLNRAWSVILWSVHWVWVCLRVYSSTLRRKPNSKFHWTNWPITFVALYTTTTTTKNMFGNIGSLYERKTNNDGNAITRHNF